MLRPVIFLIAVRIFAVRLQATAGLTVDGFYAQNFMKSNKTLFFIIAVSVAVSFVLQRAEKYPNIQASVAGVEPAEDPAAVEVGQFMALYEPYFMKQLALTHTPGAAMVVIKGDKVVYMRGFGLKQAGTQDSVDVNSVFRIGSLSKGFAGILAGILDQKNVYHLDDALVSHVPYFSLRDKEQAQRVTLKHVLSHSTGLPFHTYTQMIEDGWDLPRIASYFPQVKLAAKEGERFAYQNAVYSLLDEAAAHATGKPYAQVLADEIFTPAGMTTASATYEGIAGNPNVALPHIFVRNGAAPTPVTHKYYNAISAGGVNASIRDMGEWLQLLLGNKPDIIAQSTLDTVFFPRISTSVERRNYNRWAGLKSHHYGFGWRVLEMQNRTLVYHGGAVNNYRGEIAIDRENKLAICVLFNAHSDVANYVVPTFFEQYDLFRGASQPSSGS